MNLDMSGVQDRANDPAHLAAAIEKESPALASQHVNGLYNEGGIGAIPHMEMKKAKRSWFQSVADWRIILATLGAPAFCAGLIWIWPTTKSDLRVVQLEAASALKVETTAIAGQIKETKAELKGDINALSARVDVIQQSLNHTQYGVEELLRRSAPPPIVTAAAAPPSSPPADNPTKERKSVKKKQPVVVKPAPTGFRLW